MGKLEYGPSRELKQALEVLDSYWPEGVASAKESEAEIFIYYKLPDGRVLGAAYNKPHVYHSEVNYGNIMTVIKSIVNHKEYTNG
jgi:hypothetical protein